MTVLLTNGTVLVDETLRAQASELVRQAHDRSFRGIKLVTDDGSEVELSADLGAFVGHVLEGLARGPVSVTTLPDELTTTVAAELVGVSRPTLMKLVRDGELTAKKVGSHTRLSTTDVLAFRKTRARSRRAAFAALRALDEEFGED